jgi:hypothetical protein
MWAGCRTLADPATMWLVALPERLIKHASDVVSAARFYQQHTMSDRYRVRAHSCLVPEIAGLDHKDLLAQIAVPAF